MKRDSSDGSLLGDRGTRNRVDLPLMWRIPIDFLLLERDLIGIFDNRRHTLCCCRPEPWRQHAVRLALEGYCRLRALSEMPEEVGLSAGTVDLVLPLAYADEGNGGNYEKTNNCTGNNANDHGCSRSRRLLLGLEECGRIDDGDDVVAKDSFVQTEKHPRGRLLLATSFECHKIVGEEMFLALGRDTGPACFVVERVHSFTVSSRAVRIGRHALLVGYPMQDAFGQGPASLGCGARR